MVRLWESACVCIQWVDRWAGNVCRQSDGGQDETILSYDPSSLCPLSCLRDRVWIRMYRKANPMIVCFFLTWALPVGCLATKHPSDQQFYKLYNTPESSRFRNLFGLQLCRLAFHIFLSSISNSASLFGLSFGPLFLDRSDYSRLCSLPGQLANSFLQGKGCCCLIGHDFPQIGQSNHKQLDGNLVTSCPYLHKHDSLLPRTDLC